MVERRRQFSGNVNSNNLGTRLFHMLGIFHDLINKNRALRFKSRRK